MSQEREEFSVYFYLEGDICEAEARFVDAETAINTAKRIISSVGGRIGIVRRVIITDGGDCIAFEWLRGKGVTFPAPPEVALES